MLSVALRQADFVELMLMHGANPYLKNRHGQSAMMIAEQNKLTGIKDMLLELAY